MQQFHTINIAFLSCTENIKMQKNKEKKKKKRSQLSLMTYLTM